MSVISTAVFSEGSHVFFMLYLLFRFISDLSRVFLGKLLLLALHKIGIGYKKGGRITGKQAFIRWRVDKESRKRKEKFGILIPCRDG